MWRTLRFRLAVWNVFVVALTALATLLSLRQGVHWAVLHEMDQILLEDVQEIALDIQETSKDQIAALQSSLQRKASGHSQHRWFVQLLDRQIQPSWASGSVDALVSRQSIASDSPPFTVGNYRIVSSKMLENEAGIEAIRVGAALTLLTDDMSKVDRMFLLASAAVLLVAPMLGYWLAGTATHQMGAIIQTASRLRPGKLEERLPITGSGDELDRLALTINRLLDRLAENFRDRRDFLANAAHELRTPLAAIRTSIEVELENPSDQRHLENLMLEIIDQGMALETLVNQLLLISESEAERFKLDPQPVRINEIAAQAADMFMGTAELKNIRMTQSLQPGCVIAGSTHLLRQLVNNLLDNAIKYTQEYGAIQIDVRKDEKDHSVTLSVSDNGPGIPAEDLPRIFDRFYRGVQLRVRDETAGTGLGLSICQAVAEAHQGEIRCFSEAGAGATFRVRFPAWQENGVLPSP